MKMIGEGVGRGGGEASRARGRDQMVMGSNTCKYKPLRSRAGVRESFYDPTIESEVDTVVDFAMTETGWSRRYRSCWCFYCLQLGINTFVDQLDSVMSCYRQGEIQEPPKAFHARLRRMLGQFDRARADSQMRKTVRPLFSNEKKGVGR